MSYATQADMLTRYGLPRLVQLTDINEPQVGELVPAVLASRLDDATDEINGYLAGRMATPLATVPGAIRLLCCRIAYYLLLGPGATDNDLADVRAARAYLAAVAEGKILLTAPADVVGVGGEGAVQFSTGAKDWARES